MRFSFSNKNLQFLYTEGPAGLRGRKVAKKFPVTVINAFIEVMALIKVIDTFDELSLVAGLKYHQLKGNRAGQKAMWLNRQVPPRREGNH